MTTTHIMRWRWVMDQYYRNVLIEQTPEGRFWTRVRGGRFGRAETFKSLETIQRKIDDQLRRESIWEEPKETEEE